MPKPVDIDWKEKHLNTTTPAPAWFENAINAPFESRFVTVSGCDIHYLEWAHKGQKKDGPSILFVHGGGAHAHWWRFTAPLLEHYRVAAIDLSGMGDSGRRKKYSASLRSKEIQAVLENSSFVGKQAFVVGHSFGGYMSMRFAADYGDLVGGVVIVDSPVYRPDGDLPITPRRALSLERYYPSFEIALDRFKLLPAQQCRNEYIVEFIARHSIHQTEQGWTWKFDVSAMGKNRWSEPFDQHIKNSKSRMALIYGERSALVSQDTARYMSTLMKQESPVTQIADAAHHLMLDQPHAFVESLKAILEQWSTT